VGRVEVVRYRPSGRSRRRVFWRAGLAVAGACVLAAIAGVATLAIGQRHLIYVTDQTRPDFAAAGLPSFRDVVLRTTDGLTLVSWYMAPPAASAPVLIYFHGNAGLISGHAADRARLFAAAGLGVLLVEYRGYGGNPGAPSETGLAADAQAALDFIAAEGIAPGRRVVYGESLGTGVAVGIASERRVAAVILEAPFTSLLDLVAYRYPFLPRPLAALLLSDRFDSLARIAAIRAPVLILHGDRDTIVPADLGRRLFDAAAAPKAAWFSPVANHNNLFRHGAMDQVVAFLRDHVDGFSGPSDAGQPASAGLGLRAHSH